MTGAAANWLLLFTAALIVSFRAYWLARRVWNYPLDHGSGYFLGLEVPPGFYEGAGARPLRSYHATVLAEHGIEAAALAALLVSGRWELVPVWAGGCAVLFVATMAGITAYLRRTLCAQPQPMPRIAVALETRRLRDHISWQAESLVLLILTASWLLLLTHPNPGIDWLSPLVTTYSILGLLPAKILVIRSRRPLPADRTLEHHSFADANRRYSLATVDAFRRISLAVLAGYALLHGWPGSSAPPAFRWLLIAVALAFSLHLMVVLSRGSGRLKAMGRGLRPPGSWSGPFGVRRCITPAGWLWIISYLGGLALLLLVGRHF